MPSEADEAAAMEAEPLDSEAEAEAEAAEATGKGKSGYSKESKVKRYHSILREFMAYFHGRSGEGYPADREFTKDELSAVQPHDIVNWMNVKMFGTIVPDFSGATSISGSHHTLAFWRKGLGYFMPAGTQDWNPEYRTGNPTRSKEVKDLIQEVKELNDRGTLTPRKQPNNSGSKRRSSEDGDEGGQKKSARKAPPAESGAPTPIGVSDEFKGLLRQMHAQKASFIRGLDQLGAAVNKMKADVEVSYAMMIGQLANVSEVAMAPAADAPCPPLDKPFATSLIPRSRNLFTVWRVINGRLTPLPADWQFPKKISAKKAMLLWFLGEPSSNTPPLQYVTTAHMKHVKGSAEAAGKVRRFMKVARYLGLKAGYWCETWDSDRIDTLWSKIWPGIEATLGEHVNDDAADGSVNCRKLVNSLNKHSGIFKEMASVSETQPDDYAATVVEATEEALRSAQSGDGGEGTEEASANTNLDLLWGIHHGRLNPLPATWDFPSHIDMISALKLWFLGDPDQGVPPLRYVHSSYVLFIKSGTGYLSKLRCVMKVIKHHGIQLGCWRDDEWDVASITVLWNQVWQVCQFQHGRVEAVSWQSVYNKMHEGGMIKAVNADQNQEDEQELGDNEDNEAGQEMTEV